MPSSSIIEEVHAASLRPADMAGDRAGHSWTPQVGLWRHKAVDVLAEFGCSEWQLYTSEKNLSSRDEQNKEYLLSFTVLFFSHASHPSRLACTLKSHAASWFHRLY